MIKKINNIFMPILIKTNVDDINLTSFINNLKNPNLICCSKCKSKNITNESDILSVIVTNNNFAYP